ncbi:basic salivary proline-rich protein 2-like [Lepus europaeus]|uniref:basic salivary proline-rich protein 2-like n=1 Tax=Lepus europaeus TaxID=9983 RepID=UPI002B496C69|nr:basic salivary proline-rich protein 2-like [Lepus europaeus]
MARSPAPRPAVPARQSRAATLDPQRTPGLSQDGKPRTGHSDVPPRRRPRPRPPPPSRAGSRLGAAGRPGTLLRLPRTTDPRVPLGLPRPPSLRRSPPPRPLLLWLEALRRSLREKSGHTTEPGPTVGRGGGGGGSSRAGEGGSGSGRRAARPGVGEEREGTGQWEPPLPGAAPPSAQFLRRSPPSAAAARVDPPSARTRDLPSARPPARSWPQTRRGTCPAPAARGSLAPCSFLFLSAARAPRSSDPPSSGEEGRRRSRRAHRARERTRGTGHCVCACALLSRFGKLLAEVLFPGGGAQGARGSGSVSGQSPAEPKRCSAGPRGGRAARRPARLRPRGDRGSRCAPAC